MDLSNPMTLANAMIFHDQWMQQQSFHNATYSFQPEVYGQSSYQYYQPMLPRPSYFSTNANISPPPENILNIPISLEDIRTHHEYFRGILGYMEDDEGKGAIIIACHVDNPSVDETGNIRHIIKDKLYEALRSKEVSDLSKDIERIYIVITGGMELSSQNVLTSGFKGDIIKSHGYLIMRNNKKRG